MPIVIGPRRAPPRKSWPASTPRCWVECASGSTLRFPPRWGFAFRDAGDRQDQHSQRYPPFGACLIRRAVRKQLEPAVGQTPTPPGPSAEVRTVLLTGATGFCGRYLALEWLERMSKVLPRRARASSSDSARTRQISVPSTSSTVGVHRGCRHPDHQPHPHNR